MKEFLSTYIELLQNNHDMVGQVSILLFQKFFKVIQIYLVESVHSLSLTWA